MINWKKGFVLVLSLILLLTFITLLMSTSAASAASREKIVRFCQSWPLYIDPAVGMDNVALTCTQNLYDTLITFDVSGIPQPLVAKSWEFNADTLTYTLKINKGINFHNGDELKASDVVFSLKRMTDIGEGYGYLFIGVVKNCSAPDTETVTITLEHPVATFLFYLSHVAVLNEKQVIENAKKEGPYGEFGDYAKDWLLRNDAGSGPYMVKEVNLAEYVIGVRNPNYWQEIDKNAPDSFKIIGVTEPVTVRTLMAKQELEITDVDQPTENYYAMSKLPGVKVANLQTGSPMAFMFNTSKPPFDDVHFRRAVKYIFDYEVCQKQILPDSLRAVGPISRIVPGGDPSAPLLERDLEKAKTELAQSPYATQLDQYPIELWWNSVVPDQEKISLLIQSNCQEIGIKVNITKSSWTLFVDAAANSDTTPHIFPVTFSGHTYPEAFEGLTNMYDSSTRGTFFNMHWLDDTTQLEIDSMLDEANVIYDTDERYEKYRVIIAKVLDLALDIFAVDFAQRYAYQAGYLMWPTAKAAETGGKINIMTGLRLQFKDMRFIDEE
jgi:peptide/nickel transport system substrate-binding protein